MAVVVQFGRRRRLSQYTQTVQQVACRTSVIECRGVVLLAQFVAVNVQQEWNVGEARGLRAQQSVQQDLVRGRIQQIAPAHDVRDPLPCVVDHDCQLVCVQAITTSQDQIIRAAWTRKHHRSEDQVIDVAGFMRCLKAYRGRP